MKGASGVMGAGNTSVLMQLLVGMLDAALARQQDLVPEAQRTAVALKVDEAPLVLNRGFAETMALKRSAGLETVACWQTEAQWTEREVRDQLDALFAHRVYFATASVRDARSSVELTMAEFSDSVRPGIEHLSALGHPDARLHLPRHHAIVELDAARGSPVAVHRRDDPLRIDPRARGAARFRQQARGAVPSRDLRQPHGSAAARRCSSRPAAGRKGVGRPAVAPAIRARTAASSRPRGRSRRPQSFSELVELDGRRALAGPDAVGRCSRWSLISWTSTC